MAKKAKVSLDSVECLTELERAGIKFDIAGEDEVRFYCPFHEKESGHSPSFYLNTRKKVGMCRSAACNRNGDIASILAAHLGVERSTVIVDLSSRYDLGVTLSISPALVEKYHENIWTSGPFIQALRDRGVTDEMIRMARIGFDTSANRITIPIYDEHNRIVNLRRYLPGAPSAEKMRNAVGGYGALALYLERQLKEYKSVWVCGGEMKALVVAGMLNPHGVGAVSPTAGEGSWTREFAEKFRDKTVYVCTDIDAAGVAAANKWAKLISFSTSDIRIIHIPLDPEKHPKGDINDYVGKEHATPEMLLQLMVDAERYVNDLSDPDDSDKDDKKEPEPISIVEMASSSSIGKTVTTEAVVAAMDETPYIIPKEIICGCDRSQPNCVVCPINAMSPDPKGLVTLTIRSTSISILGMMETSKKLQREQIKEALRIPACKSVGFQVKSHYDVFDVRLTPQLTLGTTNSHNVVQPAVVVGEKIETNTPYTLRGRVHPHPKNQQAVLVIDKIGKSRDDFASFQPTPEELAALRVFQPVEWTVESVGAKLNDVYDDFASNVTRIFSRPDLHLVIDLTLFSPLYMPFDGRIEKGWVNSLILGDSGQGKSECVYRMLLHYGVGEIVDSKNATAPGLIGGVKEMGSRWMISWGVIPLQDRRAVVLEEVKGIAYDVIGRLTDMRSRGVARISMIENRQTHARTRQLWVSNPRSTRKVRDYNFGIETIPELIGSLEDVRRFDIALLVSAGQVDPAIINREPKDRPPKDHVYSATLNKRLVLWAWTRKPEEVVFSPEAEAACVRYANELCSKFSDAMPLIDRGTMRHKLARLSAALASRTYSVDEQNNLLVRDCHVQYLSEFILRIYSDKVFGYLDYSLAKEYADRVMDPELIEKQIKGTRYPADLVEHLLHAPEITLPDLCDWCEMDKDAGQRLLSFFVRKHAIYRIKNVYVKTSGFIDLLKAMKTRGVPTGGVAAKDERL